LMTFRTEYNFSVATSIIFLMNFMLLSFSQMAWKSLMGDRQHLELRIQVIV
jgi:hypothetical protein